MFQMSKIFNFVAVGVSLLAFIAVFIFVFKYSDVITPTDPTNIVYLFDWHAPLGAFGVLIALFIGGQAFHLMRGGLETVQITHAVFLWLGTVSMAIAVAFIFESHKQSVSVDAQGDIISTPIDDMYSVHAWLGISFFVIFGVQLLGGAFTFLIPVLPALLAVPVNVVRSYHKAFGHALVLAGGAVVTTGIFDRQRIATDFSGAEHYDAITRWANVAAMLTFVAAILTSFSLSLKVPRFSTEDETKPLNPDL